MSLSSGTVQSMGKVRGLASAPYGDAQTEGNLLFFETDGNSDFIILAQRKIDLSWLMVLLGLLCILETAALLYVVGYFIKNRTAALAAPALLAAVIVPASAPLVCMVLGGICLAEGAAIALFVALIRRRERREVRA